MTDIFLLRISGGGMATPLSPQGQANSCLSCHTRGLRRVSIRTEQDGFPITDVGNDDRRWKDQKFCESQFLILIGGHEQFGDPISKPKDVKEILANFF